MSNAESLPRISIVTPTLNQCQLLEETIQNVLAQDYPNLEYIVVDGGSSDGTMDVIRKYEKHLAAWISEPDGGAYDAVNKGFARSTGEIMAWLNGGDLYCRRALNSVATAFSDLQEVEWITSLRPGLWDAAGYSMGFDLMPGFGERSFLDGYHLPGPRRRCIWIQQESTFWRRSLWTKAGSRLDCSYSLAADFELWARFIRHARLYGMESPLGGFRLHDNHRSSDMDRYLAEANRALKTLRQGKRWWPSLRCIVYELYLTQPLNLWPALESRTGYQELRVQRASPRDMRGGWRIQKYRYWPG